MVFVFVWYLWYVDLVLFASACVCIVIVDYINVKGNDEALKRLRQIAKLNNILINPDFSIIDLRNIKNIENKLKKL